MLHVAINLQTLLPHTLPHVTSPLDAELSSADGLRDTINLRRSNRGCCQHVWLLKPIILHRAIQDKAWYDAKLRETNM